MQQSEVVTKTMQPRERSVCEYKYEHDASFSVGDTRYQAWLMHTIQQAIACLSGKYDIHIHVCTYMLYGR